MRDGGCYGHVDGPRFNTRSEIRMLMGAGVTAVSQTAGPETVLAGEAKLPYALLGYATDYANGVKPEAPTPVEELIRLVAASTETFARTLARGGAARDGRARAGGDAFLLGLTNAARWPPSSSARSPRPTTPGSTSSWATTARGRCVPSSPRGHGAGPRRSLPGAPSRPTTLDAARAALHGHDGPVLLAAPDVPALDQRLARAALDDLAAGCDIALGAAHDARPYLLAVPRLDPELLALVERSLDGGVLGAFAERGVTLGMLRHERRLASAGDARALAIDPLAPPDLVALVRGRLPEPPRR